MTFSSHVWHIREPTRTMSFSGRWLNDRRGATLQVGMKRKTKQRSSSAWFEYVDYGVRELCFECRLFGTDDAMAFYEALKCAQEKEQLNLPKTVPLSKVRWQPENLEDFYGML